MDNNDNELVFDEGFNAGKDLSFKSIVLEQYRRVCKEGSKEMVTGGVKRILINGEINEIYFPDQPQVFMNSVTVLIGLISPIGKKSKHEWYLNKYKELMDEIKELETQKNNKIKNVNNQNSNFVKANSYNPLLSQQNRDKYNSQINNILNGYNYELLNIYKNKLFVLVSELMNKENYFDELGM